MKLRLSERLRRPGQAVMARSSSIVQRYRSAMQAVVLFSEACQAGRLSRFKVGEAAGSIAVTDRIHRIVSKRGMLQGSWPVKACTQTHTPQERAPLTLGTDKSRP